MSVVVEYDCDVKASTKRTWAYISDFARMPDWDPAIVESRQVTPGGIGVGTVFDMVTRFNGSTSRIRCVDSHRGEESKKNPGFAQHLRASLTVGSRRQV